ncbi:hypothetical protein [uncultured Enterococcus sp.]|uniref:hypothetical protein n=1 Tax=uncultured Enterococcus sp. TaxID=167972 RepID=UPI003747BE8D
MTKEKIHRLTVKKSEKDVRLNFRKSGTLRQISFSTNKVLEMRKNGLLLPEKVAEYTIIELIYDEKEIEIPVIKGSGKYCGHDGCLLRFLVDPIVQLKRGEQKKWHLQTASAGYEEGA